MIARLAHICLPVTNSALRQIRYKIVVITTLYNLYVHELILVSLYSQISLWSSLDFHEFIWNRISFFACIDSDALTQWAVYSGVS